MAVLTALERRVRAAGLLIATGLLIEIGASVFVHPLAFIAFLLVSCPLVAFGIVLFLWGLVSRQSA